MFLPSPRQATLPICLITATPYLASKHLILDLPSLLPTCKLGATELNEIYTNLPVVVGQTITVSNNVGTTGDDPTIATAKGWTVTG
jgi:hypothetical protein